MKRLFSIFAFALLAASSGLAKTFIIDISTGRPAVSNEAYYHGETIAFRAVCGGEAVTNIAYACIYYQTNGMGNVWWKTDGLVFHPTNDVGAASYRFFLEGRDDLGRDWHANGLLRLINSPGFTPNAVTPPVQTLNFDGIEVSNAPWPTFEEVDDTVSNAVSNALENIVTDESDPVWNAEKASYATTADLARKADAQALTNGTVDALFNTLEIKGDIDNVTFQRDRSSLGEIIIDLIAAFSLYNINLNYTNPDYADDWREHIEILEEALGEEWYGFQFQKMAELLGYTTSNHVASATNATHQSLASDLASATNSLAAAETAAHQSLASGFADSLASAINATLAAARADLDAEINLWFRSTNAWISVSNGVARVYEIVGTNSVLKYEWDSAHSNDAARVAALESAMPRKIEDPRRWADWTASGVSNSTGAVMLDRGAVYFGSTNVTWATDGGFAVLTSHSLPASASGGSSQFRIGIDTEDWFGFEVTASYLVNALPTGFSVDAQTAHTATIQTAYTAGYETTPPLVYYAQTLAQPFAPWDGGIVEWTHDGAVSTATVNGVSGTSGFFMLKAEVAGGAVFRSTMPALMEGYRVESAGEYVGTLQPDSLITITSGGKTYRVMAQEVQ